MKTFAVYFLDQPGKIITILYPAKDWEVSCLLVGGNGMISVELKKYLLSGQQVLERHYCNDFKILSL